MTVDARTHLESSRSMRPLTAAAPSTAAITALVALAAFTAACDDDPFALDADEAIEQQAPSPLASGAETALNAEPIGGPVPGQQIVFVGAPDDESTGWGPVTIGHFPEPTFVDVEIRGFLHIYYAYPPDRAGRLAARYGPGGVFLSGRCQANVQVEFTYWGSFRPCRGASHPVQEVRSRRMLVHGTGRATRAPGPPTLSGCGSRSGPACFTFAGGQTVTVTPVAQALQLEADSTHVDPGTPVTFTASTSNGRRLAVREWVWVDAEPADSEDGDGTAGADPDDRMRTVCAEETTCVHPVDRRGTMYVRALVNDRQIEQAKLEISVEPPVCTRADIEIVRATGTNPGGSFTSLDGESRVEMEAELRQGCEGLEVHWEVEDAPDDAVDSPPVDEAPTGITSAFHVPMPRDLERWPAQHATMLEHKALAYRVRAFVELDGRRVESDWRTVRQTEADVIRQEYVELGVAEMPGASGDLSDNPTMPARYGAEPAFGDYDDPGASGLSWVRDDLTGFVASLADGWTHGELTIGSVYRNPVHHRQHLGAHSESPHQTGAAVDVRVAEVDATSAAGARQRHLYWTALRNTGAGRANGACTAPYESAGGTHVHYDVRSAEHCGRSWNDAR